MTKIPIPLEVWRKGDEWRRVVEVHLYPDDDGACGTVTYQTKTFGHNWTNLVGWLDWAKDAERDSGASQ